MPGKSQPEDRDRKDSAQRKREMPPSEKRRHLRAEETPEEEHETITDWASI